MCTLDFCNSFPQNYAVVAGIPFQLTIQESATVGAVLFNSYSNPPLPNNVLIDGQPWMSMGWPDGCTLFVVSCASHLDMQLFLQLSSSLRRLALKVRMHVDGCFVSTCLTSAVAGVYTLSLENVGGSTWYGNEVTLQITSKVTAALCSQACSRSL